MENKRLPRGVRNNNPLNIRRSNDRWQGLAAQQTDRSFFQFRSLAYGFRAAFIIIHTYMHKYGLCSVEQIVSRWAPPQDGNNTRAYINIVADMSHLARDKLLHWSCEADMLALVQAMAYVENGMIIAGDSIRTGYEMASRARR